MSSPPPPSPPEVPPYTPSEIGAMFLSYYQFLARAHHPPSLLQTPPPSGWPSIPTTAPSTFAKTDRVMEVLRHMPYIRGEFPREKVGPVHYKCHAIDYAWKAENDPAFFDDAENGRHFLFSENEELNKRLITLWDGHESGGRVLILDVERGTVDEEMIRMDPVIPTMDVKEYLEELKQKYLKFELVPLYGDEFLELDGGWNPEKDRRITEEEVLAQGDVEEEEDWPSEIDELWIVQTFWDLGWPREKMDHETWMKAEEEVTRVETLRGRFG